ncbi:hypothetical protein BC831DRAFT_443963 [Entophlyctis helioformis]|nr:hypothetical protein BC831DRAFT_443963 [Entophlyctis helioformis]
MADDWYISPADRFSYENQFSKFSRDEDDVTLQQLDPLFQQSRLQTDEFLQIWQLVDIKYEQRINKSQFIYFMHILNSRRRGRPLPIGLPLSIKEEFLRESRSTSQVYVRPSVNVRDVGASAHKDVKDLEAELAQLELDVSAAERERELAKERAAELAKAKDEVQGIVNYTKRHEEALDKEVVALRDSVRGFGGSLSAGAMDATRIRELISKLNADAQMLKGISDELMREQDAANASLAI